jgi:hypothetical protein
VTVTLYGVTVVGGVRPVSLVTIYRASAPSMPLLCFVSRAGQMRRWVPAAGCELVCLDSDEFFYTVKGDAYVVLQLEPLPDGIVVRSDIELMYPVLPDVLRGIALE